MRRTREQSGFTIVEVMVAALVILAALGVVVTTAVKIRGLSTTGESKAAATKVAQQELERLRSLGWERLQMDAAPTQSTTTDDIKDPLSAHYLSGTNYQPSTDAAAQPLVIGTAPDVGETDLRDVKVTPTAWQSDQEQGLIYRFVTYGDDTACGANCPSAYDYKRVTVAVTVTKPVGAIANPIVVSTEVSNPVDAPVVTTSTAGTPPATIQGITYYPYDTKGTFSTRQAITASHNKHTTRDKPDLMDQDPPPDPDPNGTGTVATYNYSADIAGSATFGRGIKKDSNCDKFDDDNKVMFWVGPILTSDVKLTGNATADLYAQTLAGTSSPGRICVSVWDVPGTLAADGKVQGTETIIGTIQSAELNPFYTTFDELQFNFRFLATGATYYTALTGRRIGIKITSSDHLAAPNAATSAVDLAIMYDHPDYPSSISLETQS
jgi:type II secretory pathway pseudopilin PulG